MPCKLPTAAARELDFQHVAFPSRMRQLCRVLNYAVRARELPTQRYQTILGSLNKDGYLAESAMARHALGSSWASYNIRRLTFRPVGDQPHLSVAPVFLNAFNGQRYGRDVQQAIQEQPQPSSKRQKLISPPVSVSLDEAGSGCNLREQYPVGTLVWAQCPRYPFWPGRVTATSRSELRVQFYGDDTNETIQDARCVRAFRCTEHDCFLAAGCHQTDLRLVGAFNKGVQQAQLAEQRQQPEQLDQPDEPQHAEKVCEVFHAQIVACAQH